jgi:DNA-binding transcriptional ArsR family regulator
MSRPAVSKHIKMLRLAGFISISDIGRERHCSLQEDGFKALNSWMDHYNQFWKEKLLKLRRLMDQKKSNSKKSN